MHLDDNSLIDLINKDKNRAFNYIVDQYAKQVFNNCLYLVRNKLDAEDLTQEVFTAIYLSITKFKGDSQVSTWIYSITINKSKEFLRAKTRHKRKGHSVEITPDNQDFLLSQVAHLDHPGIILENKERAQMLFYALDKLAENQRLAYCLYNFDGLSYKEISEILELSVSSVESLLFRAKKRLREHLEEYYQEK